MLVVCQQKCVPFEIYKNNMRILAVLFLLVGLGGSASAQLNESDTLRLQYRTALTGNVQTGNLEALTLVGRLELSAAPGAQWAVKTQNTVRYQAFFGRKADSDFDSRNFLYAGQQRALYPFAMAFLSGNFRRKINFRWFAGPGLTWQAIRRAGHVLKISLAGVYEATDFAGTTYNFPEYAGSARIGTWRATARVFGQHQVLSQRLRLFYEFYWQPSVEQANNYRWLADMGLELPVWKGLSFHTHLLYTRENVVIAGVKPEDLIFTFGISIRNHKP